MRTHVMRALCAAAAAGVALTTLGLTGAGAASATTAASQALGPPVYNAAWGGYQTAGGRWFRYVSTTVTVQPRKVPNPHDGFNGAANISLWGARVAYAEVSIRPGGGAGSVAWLGTNVGTAAFRMSPRVGDRLTINIYYDRHGHTYFAATDTTQRTTQTVRVNVGNVVYRHAALFVNVDSSVTPSPRADTRLWQFTNSHVTTYTGNKGTILGPWSTRQLIDTTTGTAAGKVVTSAPVLWNGGQNFGVWLRHR